MLLGCFFIVVGSDTLEWLFNTPIKAWEYLEIAPKVYMVAWIAYIVSVVLLVLGGWLLETTTAFLLRGKQQ